MGVKKDSKGCDQYFSCRNSVTEYRVGSALMDSPMLGLDAGFSYQMAKAGTDLDRFA